MFELFLGGVVCLFTIYYLHVRSKYSYWRRIGVAEEPGFFPFGSQPFWDVLFRRVAFTRLTDATYKNHPNERLVGNYSGLGRPCVVIRDLDLVKQILVKDFDQFSERRVNGGELISPHSKNNKYLAKMLLNLKGREWKQTRSSLTPIFTSGKLKAMVPLIHKVADECNLHLETLCGKEIEGKEIMKNFALDVIVSTGFGFDSNSFKDPDNVFKKYADLLIGKKMSPTMVLAIFVFVFSPKILQWLDLPLMNMEAQDFFANLVVESIEQRKKDGIRRNDLIDLVLDVLEKKAKKETNKEDSEDESNEEWSDEEIKVILISNSLLMFIAGFDTVSGTASIILYHLAKNQDIQERLYQEISNAINEHGYENLDYAAIMKMPYLDMVFHEALRSYPSTHLERASVTDYKVPGTDIVIPKGIFVRIPMPAIMMDEKYYPNPHQYNPENFSEENKAARNPYAYGGFGHGPKNCIAVRFAILEVKIAIYRILTTYKVLPCAKTVDKLVPDPKSRSFQPKGDVWFTLEKR